MLNHFESALTVKPDTRFGPVPGTTVTMQGVIDKIKGATYTLLPDGRTTVCQLALENGYSSNGTSACVDPANYNQALGEKYAYEDALNKIWPLEGYLLAEKLHQGTLSVAIATVCQALRDDSDYAWAWHCNLTMMAQDAGAARATADEGSARFLQLFADVDVRKNPHFVTGRSAVGKEESHDI